MAWLLNMRPLRPNTVEKTGSRVRRAEPEALHLRPSGGATAPLLGHPEAEQCALKRCLGSGEVDIPVGLFAEATDAFFGTPAGFFGARDINLFGCLGSVGEDGDMVALNLEETSGHDERLFLASAADDHLAGLQCCHQRGVLGINGELAFGARDDERIDPLLHADHPFGSNELDGQRHALLLCEASGFLDGAVDVTNHVERLLGQAVVLAF